MSFVRTFAHRLASWPLVIVVLVALFTKEWPRVEADVAVDATRYVTFCCQSKTAQGQQEDEMSWGRVLRFAPCFEAPDSRFGRQCRSESLFYYPIAVRTDRTFSFDNVTRELVLYDR